MPPKIALLETSLHVKTQLNRLGPQVVADGEKEATKIKKGEDACRRLVREVRTLD